MKAGIRKYANGVKGHRVEYGYSAEDDRWFVNVITEGPSNGLGRVRKQWTGDAGAMLGIYRGVVYGANVL